MSMMITRSDLSWLPKSYLHDRRAYTSWVVAKEVKRGYRSMTNESLFDNDHG